MQRASSAPKMQTIYTARVKDGRYSNDSPQKHYYGRTGAGFASSNSNYFFKYLWSYLAHSFLQKRANNSQKYSRMMFNTLSTWRLTIMPLSLISKMMLKIIKQANHLNELTLISSKLFMEGSCSTLLHIAWTILKKTKWENLSESWDPHL